MGDEHELCGITLFGRTKNGSYDDNRNYRNENWTSIYETDVTYIQIEYSFVDVERPSNYYFRFVYF